MALERLQPQIKTIKRPIPVFFWPRLPNSEPTGEGGFPRSTTLRLFSAPTLFSPTQKDQNDPYSREEWNTARGN